MLKAVPFFRIDLICTSNGDYLRSVRVLLSEDGQSFTPATGALAGEPTLHLDLGKAHIARYVRIEAQQEGGGLWWRIDELRVLQ